MSDTSVVPPAGSITTRLLRGMVLPMTGLALILGVGGYLAIDTAVQTVNDRILNAASRAIADSLTVEDDRIALDLSPAIFGMLENQARDNVYYSVRYKGKVITGYTDLPDITPKRMLDSTVVFGEAEYLGRKIRVVAEARRLSQIDGTVFVEVAETLDARRRIVNRLLIGLALLELALIGTTVLLLPLAVRWGLRPLHEVRDEMDRRSPADLTPLATTSVPAELRDLVGAFNAMLARLDDAISGIKRFTADASHQMRTPLSILRTHIGVLRKAEPGSEEARNSIADIDQASDRLQHLLVQLLALARADSAAPSAVTLTAVEMNALAATTTGDLALSAVRAGIDLQFERAPAEAIARTHAPLATELISNLIDNAIRYAGKGAHIAVSVVLTGTSIRVIVEDNGPGIRPADREKAFTRFTRLDASADRSGSGLGLPIARALAQALSATLRLETAAGGRGLRAVATFPRFDKDKRLTA